MQSDASTPSPSKDTRPLLSDSVDSVSGSDGTTMTTAPPGSQEQLEPSGEQPWLVYVMTMMACIGGFLFGYDTGVVTGAMIFIVQQFNLDALWHELIVSITIGAAALFAIVGAYSNGKLGRKRTILISSVLFIAGAVILGCAQNKETLLIGRFVVGCGVGMASTTVPVYISETTPPNVRGRLVTSYNLAITFGLFCACVVDGIFSVDRLNGWRYMMGLAGVPAALQLVGFCFMPESPRWLCQQERHEEARKVLSRLVSRESLDRELEAIEFSILDQERELKEHGGNSRILIRMVQDQRVRKILVLACGLQFFQQFSGINTVMYYSASIIQMSGITNDELAIWLAALVSSVNFVFTFVGIALVDKLGRRILIIGSIIGVIASLGFLAIGFSLASNNSPPISVNESTSVCSEYSYCEPCVDSQSCGFCYIPTGSWATNGSCFPIDTDNKELSQEGRCSAAGAHVDLKFLTSYCPSRYGFMSVLGLGLYLAFFAPGMGPMPWTINSEIFPLWARSAGTGAATAVNWIANLFVSMTFLTLTQTITKAGTMWLYAGISVVGLVFLVKMLPETKNKALEEILELFDKPWCSEGPCRKVPHEMSETSPLTTM